ncbi:HAUS augmin-like complex subunit 4 isoform X3 [Strongylocentrotus purpuratus]|uniref:HAUS augmin-like complex subunit 4 n=1 Tax=Strongylocentrotus purpuratus TaxID=7668 RepID=A0A7M7N4N7_STRPU|nr:HAUS augmin-like complex subunit 4 isoform X3 [Strongylocentrotus purpuratus]
MDLHNNTVIKVNMNLPVHMSESDAAQNPGCVNLLKALSQHLTEDGTSKHMEEAHKLAKEKMEGARMGYLEKHILHHEVHQLLTEHNIASHEVAPDSKTAQFYEALQQCVATAEACDYLSERNDSEEHGDKATLLGLEKDKLLAGNHQKKMVSMIQPQLIPLIEERLRKQCEELQSFHETDSSSTTGDELTFAKATQLPDVLRSEKMKLEEEKKQLKLAKLLRNKQFWQYNQILREALHTLEKLITNHRLRLQADSDSITTDWLDARCHAMSLKIRVFEAKLLCSTYTPEVLQAMKTARQQLEGAVQEREKDLMRHDQALKNYKAIGSDFEEIVREYQELTAAIDNKKWALRELKQALPEEELGHR